MAYGPDDTDYPDRRADPYRQAPVGRYVDPYAPEPHSEQNSRPVSRPAARPAPLDPFRTREYTENRAQSAHSRPPRTPSRHGSAHPLDQGDHTHDNHGYENHGYDTRGYDTPNRGRHGHDDPHGQGDRYAERDRYTEDGRYAEDEFDASEPRVRARVGSQGPRSTSAQRVGSQRSGSQRVGLRDDRDERDDWDERGDRADRDERGDRDADPRQSPPRRPDSPGGHRKTKPGKKGRKGKKVVSAKVRRRRKYIFRSVLGVFLLVFGYVGITIYPYITQPGTDPLEARVAEWGRDHHLGFAVTWLENHTYQAPATGGSLTASQLAQMKAPPAKPLPTNVPATDLPANIVPLASPAEPGEGVWQPVTMNASGVPIIEKAILRPDAQHTSELAYVAWMRQSALKFTLNPGYQQPGGKWTAPDVLPKGQNTGLVATWNGGFKLTPNDDALGGFYADGRSALPLVQGKAAEVFYSDGSIKIGQWGRDETMGPNVVGVRQNLSLLVDQGQVMADAGAGSSAKWGITVSNAFFVPRSGVGMTAKGDIVYVGGADLSVLTLAQLLKAAGAVYGMELDINTSWVSFMTYSPGLDPADPTPLKLWDFQQAANRYYQASDRDFVSVFTR